MNRADAIAVRGMLIYIAHFYLNVAKRPAERIPSVRAEGMPGDIKLRWRKQRDQKVFSKENKGFTNRRRDRELQNKEDL